MLKKKQKYFIFIYTAIFLSAPLKGATASHPFAEDDRHLPLHPHRALPGIDPHVLHDIRQALHTQQFSFEDFCREIFFPPFPDKYPSAPRPPFSAKQLAPNQSQASSPSGKRLSASKSRETHREIERRYKKKQAQVLKYIQELAQSQPDIQEKLETLQQLSGEKKTLYEQRKHEIEQQQNDPPVITKRAIHALRSQKSRAKKNPTGIVALYWELVQIGRISSFDIYYQKQIANKEMIPIGNFGALTARHAKRQQEREK